MVELKQQEGPNPVHDKQVDGKENDRHERYDRRVLNFVNARP
jgi:hypothetical protein